MEGLELEDIMIHREYIEWRDMWVTGADDDKQLKLLLVGDSIVRSYFAPVETGLKGKFLCSRMTTSTCVCDRAIEKELALLLDDYSFDVIHFNNGLHGWDYDEASYSTGLSRTLDFIMIRSPKSRLICASTTPVRRTDNLGEFDPKTDRVRERNRMLRVLATQRHLPVNDLFASVADHPEYFSEDGVHLNSNGQNILGQQVIQSVLMESSRNS